MEYRVISADNHVIEPPGTYIDRAPSALKDRASRVLPGADGGEGWSYFAAIGPPMSTRSRCGQTHRSSSPS